MELVGEEMETLAQQPLSSRAIIEKAAAEVNLSKPRVAAPTRALPESLHFTSLPAKSQEAEMWSRLLLKSEIKVYECENKTKHNLGLIVESVEFCS